VMKTENDGSGEGDAGWDWYHCSQNLMSISQTPVCENSALTLHFQAMTRQMEMARLPREHPAVVASAHSAAEMHGTVAAPGQEVGSLEVMMSV
jgi:hypothetical protein